MRCMRRKVTAWTCRRPASGCGARSIARTGCYSRAAADNCSPDREGDSSMRSLARSLAVTLALAVAGGGLLVRPAPAAEDVKVALIAPLSGRWARQGQLKKMGADMAIEEINSQGGIKALGG